MIEIRYGDDVWTRHYRSPGNLSLDHPPSASSPSRTPGSKSESPKIISSMVVPVQLHSSPGTDDDAASSMTRFCDDRMILTSCDNPYATPWCFVQLARTTSGSADHNLQPSALRSLIFASCPWLPIKLERLLSNPGTRGTILLIPKRLPSLTGTWTLSPL